MGGGNRPGMGDGNRPTTLPGQVGPGTGGGLSGGNRPGIGGGNRPTTLPGQVGPGAGGELSGGNRPGIGGGNRPTTLPGQVALGAGGGPNGNRPGIGGNRPGIGGNRPGIGNGLGNNVGNGIGNGSGNNIGNNIGNSIGGNNNFNNINVNGGGYGGRWGGGYGGGWGYPGGGYGYGGGYGGGWANNWNNGFVNPHYGGWYSGCWNGNWGNNYGYGGGWWAPLAFGAATWGLASTIGGWGLGYGSMGYGGAGYVNPYYSSIPAAVVASSPYDYSQPVVVNNYITNDGDLSNATDAQGGVGGTAAGGAGGNATAAPVNNEANAAVDDALAKFKTGDYAGALAGFDRAVKASPKDSVIHEVRALTLFALGRYPEAAATLNSVLVSAPGMDWTTISNVYGSVDAYTAHLRKLEDFCRANPDSASGHFVLAYHYLVGGHADMAAEALKVVVAKQPGDLVAKRLLEAITPPEEPKAEAAQPASPSAAASPAADTAPVGPETDLVGTWKAVSGKDTVMLTITEDSKFTWKATPTGRPAVELSGTVETARDAIALNTEKAGSMVGKVQSKGADAFDFTLVGAPKEAKPLEFQRQK
jgi:tetratricopeptide (TPR) repeat protein